jgi:hypothetical protein
MSMIQELESAQAALVAVKGEFDAFKVEASKTLDELSAAQTAELSKVKAEVLTLTESNAKLVGDIKVAQDAVLEAQAAVAVANSVKADLEAKLAKAEKALENPAFADASMTGAKTPVAEGGEATPPSSTTPTWTEFNKIKDPAARTEFWQKNEAKLREEMARANGG